MALALSINTSITGASPGRATQRARSRARRRKVRASATSAREALIVASSSRLVASFALLAASGKMSATDLGLRVEEHVPAAEAYQEKVEDTWADLRSIE